MNSQLPDCPEAATAKADGNRPRYSSSQSSPAILRLWLGGNALGFAIATVILVRMTVSTGTTPLLMGGLSALYASGIVVSSCVGVLQALILRRQIPRLRVWQWILGSILGGYLGIFLGAMVNIVVVTLSTNATSDALLLPTTGILGAMLGVSVGLGQVLVLARQVRGLRRWWLANVVGRSLGWLSAVLVGLLFIHFDINLGDSSIALLICGGIGGLIYGGVTALALPNLTPHQRSNVDRAA